MEAEQYCEDVELLVDALGSITQVEAENRLKKAQNAISTNFQRLTGRPDFSGLSIKVSPDGYQIEVTGSSLSREAVPILNQGDLNCSALSIFLALAAAPETSHLLGFVILDDPSQSLDSTSKRNLCQVLEAICDSRQLLISTMDEELQNEILKIGKAKSYYVFTGWNPTTGPQIERGLI